MKYIICKYCTHVNGNHQDTLAFSKNIYQSGKINYSETVNIYLF